MDTEVLLTYEDAAKILQVSKPTIRRYVRNGMIKVVVVNSQTKRIKKTDLEVFIDGSMVFKVDKIDDAQLNHS